MIKAPCGHEAPRPDGCKWCALAARDRRYFRLWWPHLRLTGRGKVRPARGPGKPRLSIADLAAKKRH